MIFRAVYKSGQIFFHFVTMHAFDRRTDRQAAFSSLDRVCISCSAVKTTQFLQNVSVDNEAMI